MRFVDAWRLTGPHLQTRVPSVLVDVAFEPAEDRARAVSTFTSELLRMTSALAIPVTAPSARFYAAGAALTFAAPIDLLLPATDAGEWAAHSAAAVLRGEGSHTLEPRRAELAMAAETARNPRLLALRAEAAARGLAFLWDDAEISIGLGRSSRTYAMGALPELDAVPWATLGAIPVGLVSGTNGKTTSTRLVARMAREAGRVVGFTSTDGCYVGETRLDRGDYTGPMGARMVLRHGDVDFAVLETARGGILRRGLAVDHADAALLTNVSDDHLGDYGIDDVETMARVKAVLGTVVGPAGRVILNAEDPLLLQQSSAFVAPRILFSLDPAHPAVVQHRKNGGEAWLRDHGAIVRGRGDVTTTLLAIDDIPLCMGGAAVYNVANVLGAAALASSLGIPDEAIVAALRAFDPNVDNPGRGNLFDLSGVALLLDFGHNPEGVAGAMAVASSLREPGAKLWVIAGHAGDRLDENVRDVARAIHAAAPDRVLLRDLAGYLRGRAPLEVPGIFRDELLRLGMSAEAVTIAPSEVDALRSALDQAAVGDVVVILAHVEDDAVRALLASRAAVPAVHPRAAIPAS